MKTYMRVLRAVTMLGQFGFTLITPPVVLGLVAWWLQSRFSLGSWVMLLALLLGLLTSGASAYQFFRRVLAAEKKKRQADEPPEKPVVFYRHD